MNLDSVTLICVDGRDDQAKVNSSLKALMYSALGINFNSVKLLSPIAPSIEPEGINYSNIYIEKLLGIDFYSFFMLHKLKDYVSTDFALIVQSDGFVINPEKWQDEFLEFDYIGAPWPPHWPQCSINRVGNGGFSLRSKKLLELTPNLFAGHPEDNAICLKYKLYLEYNGIKFPDAQLASRFSWEHDVPENTKDNTFGFHGHHTDDHLQHINKLQQTFNTF